MFLQPTAPPQKNCIETDFCFYFVLTIAVVFFWNYYTLPLIDTSSPDFETVSTIGLRNNS